MKLQINSWVLRPYSPVTGDRWADSALFPIVRNNQDMETPTEIIRGDSSKLTQELFDFGNLIGHKKPVFQITSLRDYLGSAIQIVVDRYMEPEPVRSLVWLLNNYWTYLSGHKRNKFWRLYAMSMIGSRYGTYRYRCCVVCSRCVELGWCYR